MIPNMIPNPLEGTLLYAVSVLAYPWRIVGIDTQLQVPLLPPSAPPYRPKCLRLRHLDSINSSETQVGRSTSSPRHGRDPTRSPFIAARGNCSRHPTFLQHLNSHYLRHKRSNLVEMGIKNLYQVYVPHQQSARKQDRAN